jgi:hypothetical protein
MICAIERRWKGKSMKRTWLLTATLIVIMILPAWSAGLNASGNWEAFVMGSKIRVHVSQDGRSLKGVAFVYNILGKKDTYHFNGHVDGGRITANHSSGDTFFGTITPDGHLVGTLRTRSGRRLAVNAVRK